MNLFETYLTDLEAIYRPGANTKETSFYGAINALFDGLGKTLKPRVRCVLTLKNQEAGMPDGGFFTASQLQRGENFFHSTLIQALSYGVFSAWVLWHKVAGVQNTSAQAKEEIEKLSAVSRLASRLERMGK